MLAALLCTLTLALQTADSPEATAANLAEAERRVRDPEVSDASAAEAGHLAQVTYRDMVVHPDLKEAVLPPLRRRCRG